MAEQSQKIDILVVGATGHLGSLITKHCLAKPNLRVHILVRNPDKDKELISQVEKAGGKVIKGDLSNPESFKGCTKGMHTVICVISVHDKKVRYDGQVALIQDCRANGVQRYVPTDFAGNFTQFTEEENGRSVVSETKVSLEKYLDSQPIKALHFWPGFFTETFFVALKFGLAYWDDDNLRLDLTTYEDTGRVVASAVSNPDRTGHVVFSGDDLSVKEINDIYNKVRGTNIQFKKYGNLQDLIKRYEEAKKKESPSLLEDPNTFGLFTLMYDPRYKFDKNNNNEFPDVKPTSLEEYLKQNPEEILN